MSFYFQGIDNNIIDFTKEPLELMGILKKSFKCLLIIKLQVKNLI